MNQIDYIYMYIKGFWNFSLLFQPCFMGELGRLLILIRSVICGSLAVLDEFDLLVQKIKPNFLMLQSNFFVGKPIIL